jgi:hypothetical protein
MSFHKLSLTIAASALALAPLALAAPAKAEETIVLSICEDAIDGSASQTHEDMARFLSGTWQMSAAGTGLTLGTNVMSVTLRWDEATETLRMEGGGGPSVTLNPVLFNIDPEGNAPFDMSAEALTPRGISAEDVGVITGCTNPPRYYWQLGAGNQRAWGGLMFFQNDAATGFMANSAGGSRSVFMTR